MQSRYLGHVDGCSRKMNVGDLVRIKGTSMVHLVKRVESVANFYKSLPPTTWVILDGQPVPYKASKVEVVNASR